MNRGNSRDWMWSEALQMLAQAERLHGQVFRPQRAAMRVPTWEPPIDVLETEQQVLILAALPGVDVDQVEAVIQNGALVIAGERTVPEELKTATIHRLELPQGRFERRVRLPTGRYRQPLRAAANGCLLVRLEKVEAARG